MCPIANERLTTINIPAADAGWVDILEFAQTFDGYEYWGSFERCAEVADARAHGTLTTLRTCLLFEHRCWRNGNEAPPSKTTLDYWQTLVQMIRVKVDDGFDGKEEVDQNRWEAACATPYSIMNSSLCTPADLPAPADASKYLLLFYFGTGTDYLALCVGRAYRDFNRTLHGIKNHPNASNSPRQYLHERLQVLPNEPAVIDQESFDSWHGKVCDGLILRFNESGFNGVRIGQAQKWLNMSLKYIFIFGEFYLPGYAKLFGLCHIPIDNIILGSNRFAEAPKFNCAWSRISDYGQYMNFQRWARARFLDQSPLAVEFKAWVDAQHEAQSRYKDLAAHDFH